MNVLLQDALMAGPNSADFYLLLKNYGMWSRYFGCTGYVSHVSESMPTPVIDDDTAMDIEKAVIKLKMRRPNVYKVFRLHYVYDMSPEKISSRIRSENREANRRPRYKRRKNYFEARPAIDMALRHINASCVRDLLKLAENLIFDELIRS